MRIQDRLSEGETRDGKPAAEAPPRRRGASKHCPKHLTPPMNRARLQTFLANNPGARLGGNFGPNHVRKVDALLSDEDRPAYETLLRAPDTTTASARAWLRARGYPVGLDAVARHRRDFAKVVKQLRETARFADALGSLARTHGTTVLSDVTLTRLQQLVMERLMRAGRRKGGKRQAIDTKELGELSKIVKDAVGTRKNVEAMRSDFERSKRRAASAAGEVARAGGNGQAVADRVREILGIPLGDGDAMEHLLPGHLAGDTEVPAAAETSTPPTS